MCVHTEQEREREREGERERESREREGGRTGHDKGTEGFITLLRHGFYVLYDRSTCYKFHR